MRGFKSGTFERHRVPRHLQRFSPVEALHALEEVDLDLLFASGKRLILLDVDNTLLPWKSEEIPQSTIEWLARARGLGFELCILSNTRNPERLGRLSEKLGVDFIRDKFKPSPKMYYLALGKYGVDDSAAVMIGDQLMTDIWGANRAGIDAIWVKPIAKHEFVGTRYLSRNIELMIGRVLHNYFQTEGAIDGVKPGFFHREVVQQLVKFAVVGAIATAVDIGIHSYLMFGAKVGGVYLHDSVGSWVIGQFKLGWPLDREHLLEAAYAPLKFGPVMLAILVSYLLNRWFTFQSTHEKANLKQAGQFYAVALVGMLISITVGTIGQRLAQMSEALNFLAGSGMGMIAGFIWNFTGQRLWTFRKK
ncbi:MAG: YqeG family HAD IIIA-type phosphatase [Fimbriimonadaceae bacterium]